MEVYNEFFEPVKEKFQAIVSKHGKDIVWAKIGLAGGKRDCGGRARSRVVYIPADSDDIRKSEVFMTASTSPKTVAFSYPALQRGRPGSSASLHPSDIPENKKEDYRKTLLENLEKLEIGLKN